MQTTSWWNWRDLHVVNVWSILVTLTLMCSLKHTTATLQLSKIIRNFLTAFGKLQIWHVINSVHKICIYQNYILRLCFFISNDGFVSCGVVPDCVFMSSSWPVATNFFSLVEYKYNTSGQSNWQRPHWIYGDPHLRRCFLGPQESAPQTGPRSVEACCTAKPRDRQTAGIIDHNSLCIVHSVHPSKQLCVLKFIVWRIVSI